MDTNITLTKPRKAKKDKWENYEYSPAAQTPTDLQRGMGLVLRGLCIAMLNLGLLAFLTDAFRLEVGVFALLMRALLSTAAVALIMVGGKAIFAGLGVAVFGLIVILVAHPNMIGFFRGSLMYTFDSAMGRLVEQGFENYGAYITDAGNMGLSVSTLHGGAMTLFAIVFAVVFGVCVMRKTVLIPVLVVSIGTLMLGFTFNLGSSNWGFAFVILAICGISVMRMFDASFRTKRKDRLNTASLGGYAGGAVMLLAFLAVVVPAAIMKDEWKDITFISEPMEIAREVVESVISGDAPNLKDLGIVKGMDEQNSRNTAPKQQSFTGETVMTVETTYTKNTPIYLRGWISTGFDGETWTTVTNDQLALYSDRFDGVAKSAGYTSGLYTSEYMTEAFYRMMDPEFTEIDEENGFSNHYDNGFISMYVNVDMKLGTGTGNLVYIPTTLSGESGLLKYRNAEKAYKSRSTYSYFDGVYVTGWFNFNKKYTTKTYVPLMTSSDFGENLNRNLAMYQIMKTLLKEYNSGADRSELYWEDRQNYLLQSYGIELEEDEETYFDRYLKMSEAEQVLEFNRYVTMVTLYSQYANELYGQDSVTVKNPLITSYANDILASLGGIGTTHDKVLATVQYMVDNYKYSMTPKLPTAIDGFDGFLRETKQGYCVQFATAVTLILREMGITARYVEGYVAAKFDKNEETGYMTSNVTDLQAHAWVEVYYEGYGWMPYETTAAYAGGFYGSSVSIGGSISGGGVGPSLGGDTNIDYSPDTDLPLDDTPTQPTISNDGVSAGEVFLVILIIAGVGVGGFFLIRWMRDRADTAMYNRRRKITDAINGAISDENFASVAGEINEEILAMLSVGGYAPQKGELPREFAKRLDEEEPFNTGVPLSVIMSIIQKQEFGTGVTKEELAAVAEYLDTLWKEVYRSKSRTERFWCRYIRCTL